MQSFEYHCPTEIIFGRGTEERVAEKIDKISVFGGLDQVLNGLVHIKPN